MEYAIIIGKGHCQIATSKMTKRKLSVQQKTRIAKNQQDEFGGAGDIDSTDGGDWNGRVISHYGQQLDVEILKGEGTGSIIRCHQRANLPTLVPGDNVLWHPGIDDLGIIVAHGGRHNLFGRPDGKGQLRPIAANLDYVIIVFAVIPKPFPNLVDRYLVAVNYLNLEPLIILNKIDLLVEESEQKLDNMMSIYEELGYSVLQVSALQGSGIKALEEQLRDKTAVLVGQSGVGKSSLVNCLGFEELTSVGDLSSSKNKGTHNTTTARLFHLGNFDLIDSPGIREFSLSQMAATEVLNGFIELKKFSLQCKFRDCRHKSEPGCAIEAAIKNGEVSSERFKSYMHILSSMKLMD